MATPVGANGARLPLASVLILLNVNHPKFDAVYGAIRPFLPVEIQMDFDMQIALRSKPQELLRQTESSINRLRSFLQPLTKAVFSQIEKNTLKILPILRSRGILIFNLKDTEFLAPEHSDVLGRIITYMLITAQRSVSRHDRVPCFLYIDEAQRILTRDLLIALSQGRKWGLACWLATQTVAALETVEEGFGMAVLSQVRTIICMQQRLPADLEILVDMLFRPNLSFNQLWMPHQITTGYTWNEVTEFSENWSATKSWSEASTRAVSIGTTSNWSQSIGNVVSNALATTKSWATSKTDTQSHADSSGSSAGSSLTSGANAGTSPVMIDGTPTMIPTASHSDGNGEFTSASESSTDGESQSRGKSEGGARTMIEAIARTLSNGFGGGQSHSVSEAFSRTVGGSTSVGGSMSRKKIPLANHETFWVPHGLERDIATQFEVYKQLLATLPSRFAAVRRDGVPTAVVRIDDVDDPFPNPQFKAAVIAAYEAKLRALHPYWFKPDVSPAADEARIDAFLAAAKSSNSNAGGGAGNSSGNFPP